ncbi:MAG: hypothetical protein IJS22_04835 [Lachnospiraceae bacterium]|nr:hypothetical protein [Lachnospiraceae bacterium]
MVVTIIYLAIIVFLLFFIIWNMFTEKDIMLQIDAALVIIPLVLRLLLIK